MQRTLRDSRVISEFLLKAIYDDKHRFRTLGVGEYPTWEQKGLREPLLCQACETKPSLWETYARNLMTGKIPVQFEPTANFTGVSGIDYAPFKLFQHSTLWLAGVSTLQFSSRANLGPHEEMIRKMLLHEDPGEPDQYACLMWEIRLGGAVSPTITSAMSVFTLRLQEAGGS